ncbi:NADP-specific glutamate dehydrogenase [candidate division TA06 bacterium]|uniref:Glutamate dehydrogenase n=1 Tax=candidate division TA06 bacterium TaxID=2250710 RepID=A0A933MJU8_UNCT6|nr:NADP-specific glutamate dehydrogenase [candidate division TA06 bacterium]
MSHITDVIAKVKGKNPGEPEFHQAVEEVMKTLEPTVAKHPEFVKWKIYERICEPDRVVMFRVPWVDDKGEVQINKGFRVQFNNAIGPYKGGLRFHPSVNLGIIKFLGFEQIFKNSLTTLAMGGGKGGSDFDPKGKSDLEVMKFTQSFMRELFRHIGADVDVPAGDIGVGGREIGFMYGYYKKIRNEFTGVLTGRALEYGGSLIRPEATGYGAVYFGAEMLATQKKDYKGLRCLVSGKGNVTQYTIEKITQLGGKAMSISDSGGTIIDEEGIDAEKLKYVMEIENVRRGRAKEYVEKYKSAKYYEGKSVWDVVKDGGLKFDCAFPSATQNEINEQHAAAMVKNGCFLVSEGANMPSNLAAIKIYQENNVLYGPAKAANAGGVATSGLEMSQQSSRWYWDRNEVDQKLQRIMKAIHQQCLDASEKYATKGDYLAGANIAGFVKVAKAMVAQGVV